MHILCVNNILYKQWFWKGFQPALKHLCQTIQDQDSSLYMLLFNLKEHTHIQNVNICSRFNHLYETTEKTTLFLLEYLRSIYK